MDKEEELKLNQRLSIAVSMTDQATFVTIFTFFLKDTWEALLQETAKFILFPAAAAFATIQMILAWRRARLESSTSNWTHAGVEIIAGLAIIFAVASSLIAAPIFGAIAPIVFTALLAFKTVYNLGAMFYYLYKGYEAGQKAKNTTGIEHTNFLKEQKDYQAKAYRHGVGAFALLLATIAVPFVMIALKPIVAIVGIASGVIGLLYGAYMGYKEFTSTSGAAPAIEKNRAVRRAASKDDDQLTETLLPKKQSLQVKPPIPTQTLKTPPPSSPRSAGSPKSLLDFHSIYHHDTKPDTSTPVDSTPPRPRLSLSQEPSKA